MARLTGFLNEMRQMITRYQVAGQGLMNEESGIGARRTGRDPVFNLRIFIRITHVRGAMATSPESSVFGENRPLTGII
jgi:hypothetical protein